MKISGREKALLFGSMAVVTLLLLDQYALTPLLEHQDAMQTQRDRILADIKRDQKLFAERKNLVPKWNSIISTGLKHDPDEAEGQLLHALRDWAKECGLTFTSIKPERPESKAELREIQISASGTASMESVSKFVWKLQSASFPLKITAMQLGSRNDSSSDLALQVKISTLYYIVDRKTTKPEKSAPLASGDANSGTQSNSRKDAN